MNEHLKEKIRTVPHFPKRGVMFRDVTTLLKDKDGFQEVIDALEQRYRGEQIDLVAGIESRGFILAGALAHRLNAGFIPIRKKGKLPAATEQVSYATEYSVDTVEVHKDAIRKGERVLLVDDLVATGGSALAAAELIERLGGELVEIAFIIDLPDLGGKRRLEEKGYTVFSLVEFEGE
jgi:adenine phosphoribosyltransferase